MTRGDAPVRFLDRIAVADHDHIGRQQARQAEAEGGGDGEQRGLSLVSRKPVSAVACTSELNSSVWKPPILSLSQPQNWRARKAHAQQHRQHGRAVLRGEAEIAAIGHDVLHGHRHRHAAGEDRDHQQGHQQVGRQAERRIAMLRPAAPPRRRRRARSGGGCRKIMVSATPDDQHEGAEPQHGLAPADMVDAELQQRRPDRAGDRLARGDQRHRRPRRRSNHGSHRSAAARTCRRCRTGPSARRARHRARTGRRAPRAPGPPPPWSRRRCTIGRMPSRPASQPATMPPNAAPT